APPRTAASIAPLAFPTILPPYGIAVLILLLAAAPGWGHAAAIFAVFIGVLLVDLLAMTFSRQIVGAVGEASLRIVGTILGVLQLALAVQMVQAALVLLRVLPPFPATLPG
ncbi:MAG: hypothetical protein IRZ00_17790, partial [Gemmatimonadetes bacterium]|nr:hypothetical protein [Gemmatimonadota bacterium]